MVTKIVVQISSEIKAASAKQSIHDIINDADEICGAERGDYKIISAQLCDIQGNLNKEVIDEHSYEYINDDMSNRCEPKDSNADDEKGVDSREQNNDNAGKKSPLLMLGNRGDTKEKTKRRRRADKFIDLTDVPPQSPILRGVEKGSASKYKGVTFSKTINKWQARIQIDGKNHCIGYYEDEEEAAVDYARAVFKYKAGRVERARPQRSKQKLFDLSDVPPQLPILRSRSNGKGGTSKYKGVYLDKKNNKWRAQIKVDGKNHCIGWYENDEEAAIEYARAAFKYGTGRLERARAQCSKQKFIDLTDVPLQLPIMSRKKTGISKYQGLNFDKKINKWQARIQINGKNHSLGYYDNEEEAAVEYARAAFKYGPDQQKAIDLNDVPPQLLIPKSEPQYEAVSKHRNQKGECSTTLSADGKVSFPMELANKGGRIGIYLPDERKARIARFHAKRRKGHRKRARRGFDLTGVPPQLPILKGNGNSGTSKYRGVSFITSSNKWRAQICISGTPNVIGYYDDEEEAAVDYARAVFKYMTSCEYKQR